MTGGSLYQEPLLPAALIVISTAIFYVYAPAPALEGENSRPDTA